jgi:N-acetylated-alpha-linked acidic dipeptidase
LLDSSGVANIDGYGRRGTRADFQVLKDAGIQLEGKIALANYGGIYRGTKVKNAQDNGMAGCVLFTDPLDDGQVTVENGYKAYPGLPFLTNCFFQACADND